MYALASDEAAATRTAGMLFRRGFAYVGRAADNPGQKGGFAVSTGGERIRGRGAAHRPRGRRAAE